MKPYRVEAFYYDVTAIDVTVSLRYRYHRIFIALKIFFFLLFWRRLYSIKYSRHRCVKSEADRVNTISSRQIDFAAFREDARVSVARDNIVRGTNGRVWWITDVQYYTDIRSFSLRNRLANLGFEIRISFGLPVRTDVRHEHIGAETRSHESVRFRARIFLRSRRAETGTNVLGVTSIATVVSVGLDARV